MVVTTVTTTLHYVQTVNTFFNYDYILPIMHIIEYQYVTYLSYVVSVISLHTNTNKTTHM